MFGEINAWYYKALGGIFPDEENPGFKNIILKPKFVDGLESFEAKHESPYGMIISSWEKTESNTNYNATIPANSTATLYLTATELTEKGKNIQENSGIEVMGKKDNQFHLKLKSGNYSFEIIN
jgi:alpha-L-rhamnosidase